MDDETRSQTTEIDGYEGNRWTKERSLQPRCESQAKKKLSLEELKTARPPGYAEFEAAVKLEELEEEIALLLWEDIFKPLSSHFESLRGDS